MTRHRRASVPPAAMMARTDDRELAISRALATGLALLIHLVILMSVDVGAAARRPALRATEIEIAPPPPPPPPPREEPPPPRRAASDRPARPVPARARPARPSRVLTGAAPAGDAPVDFATDERGSAFNSQVVAAGADEPAETRAAPVARPRAESIAAASDLTAAARLEEAEPCAGFYPRAAAADRGEAILSLVVRASGRVASAAVVAESPGGEGFGASARRCLTTKRFSPARDRQGRPVNAAATIRVRFSR